MLTIIYILEIFLLIGIGIITFYLLFLSIIALKKRKIYLKEIKAQRSFAVIIPAHNEELTISRTINSILKIDYPKNLWDLYVIADNCTDKTAEVSNNLGAIVLERHNIEQRGKGYALRWCMDKILKEKNNYDAFVVVDADTIVQQNLLKVLNQYLESGSQVIQVADLVEPQPESWSSEITRLGFMLYNYVRPLGRKNLGFTSGLKGNGMCFSTELLKNIPWSAWSLTEDLEYGIVLLLNGIVVNFAPETTVLATMPKNPKYSESQRSRWERGRYPIIKKYITILLINFLKSKSFKYFDALLELITPPVVNLFLIIVMMIFLNLFSTITGILSLEIFIYTWIVLLIASILHVLIGLKAVNADKMLYKAFLYIPRYIIWKIRLYISFPIKKFKNDWIRTSRESN